MSVRTYLDVPSEERAKAIEDFFAGIPSMAEQLRRFLLVTPSAELVHRADREWRKSAPDLAALADKITVHGPEALLEVFPLPFVMGWSQAVTKAAIVSPS